VLMLDQERAIDARSATRVWREFAGNLRTWLEVLMVRHSLMTDQAGFSCRA
jgi:hypothetical protein